MNECPFSNPELIAFEAVRSENLLHDEHDPLSLIGAGRVGKFIEPYRMFWIEDLTIAEKQACCRASRA